MHKLVRKIAKVGFYTFIVSAAAGLFSVFASKNEPEYTNVIPENVLRTAHADTSSPPSPSPSDGGGDSADGGGDGGGLDGPSDGPSDSPSDGNDGGVGDDGFQSGHNFANCVTFEVNVGSFDMNKVSSVIVIEILVVVALLGGIFWYYKDVIQPLLSVPSGPQSNYGHLPFDELPRERKFKLALHAVDARDFELADEYLTQIIENPDDLNDQWYQGARLYYAENIYNQRHLDPENEKKGIRLLQEIFTDPNSTDYIKARAINLMLGFYYKDKEFSVMRAIFEVEPFLSIVMEDPDTIAKGRPAPGSWSLRTLAEWADELGPTGRNKLRIARWYGSELLENSDLTPEERTEYAEKIIVLMEDGSELFFNTDAETGGTELFSDDGASVMWRARIIASFHYHRAFLEAVLALEGYDEYRDAFEEDYVKVRDIHDGYASAADRDDGNIAQIIIPTNVFHAAFLNELYGTEKRDEVISYLDAALWYIDNSDPELTEYIRAVVNLQKRSGGDFPLGEHINTYSPDEEIRYANQDYHYGLVVKMALIHEPFKQFLIENGWDERQISLDTVTTALAN